MRKPNATGHSTEAILRTNSTKSLTGTQSLTDITNNINGINGINGIGNTTKSSSSSNNNNNNNNCCDKTNSLSNTTTTTTTTTTTHVGSSSSSSSRASSSLSLSSGGRYSRVTTVRRFHTCSILTLGFVGLYSLLVSRYLLAERELSLLLQYGEKNVALRRCLDEAGGLWTPLENNNPVRVHRQQQQQKQQGHRNRKSKNNRQQGNRISNHQDNNNDNDDASSVSVSKQQQQQQQQQNPELFRILCTSLDKRILWGSYKLRCIDLKHWADTCVPNVDITVGVSIEQLHERWGNKQNINNNNRDNNNNNNNNANSNSNATRTVVVTKANNANEAKAKAASVGSGDYHDNDNHNNNNIDSIDDDGDGDDDDVFYNATIFVKSLSRRDYPQFGNKFIDVVDEYNWKQENIPTDMHLIFQTRWQGPELYPNHTASVVEHWYNSFPADMTNTGDPDYIPSAIEQKSPRHLSIATIWNTRRGHDPTEGGCPKLTIPNVKYSCLDKDFDITSWYLKVVKGGRDSECDMLRTMALKTQLGPGMLYYNVFRKFDALVVLAKNHTEKLEYGNVQRAVSQMRSGVPVLLEIRGRVFEDFMDKYNYSCAFRRYQHEQQQQQQQQHSIDGNGNNSNNNNSNSKQKASSSRRALLSFDEAVERLKNPDIRRECQRQGLEIVKDYSPSKIGQKFLRTVGYKGDFQC